MRQTTGTGVGRAVVALSCAAALVVSGCGSEVLGQGSVATGPAHGTSPDTQPGVGSSPPGVEPPPAGAVVDYQIGGAYPPSADVGVVVRDRSEPSVDGVYSVCYLNAFQAQPDEASAWSGQHADLVLRDPGGDAVKDTELDEPLLDISSDAMRSRLAATVDGWLADCADRGFRAVEPDNSTPGRGRGVV